MAAAAAKRSGRRADRVLVSSTGVIGVRCRSRRSSAAFVGMSHDLSGRPARRRRRHHDDGHVRQGAVRRPCGRRDDHVGREGLGDDRAEHGDDARLHLHGRRESTRRRSTACCATRCTCRSTCSRSTPTRARRTRARSSRTDSPAAWTERAFAETLTAGCIRMTEMLARDGEGAKHLHPRDGARRGERRRGAARREVARQLAAREDDGARRRPERRATADGGRQVLRLCDLDPSRTDASINGHQVVRGGRAARLR